MNIIVNGRFLTHKVTGVERFAREIMLELDKLINPGEIEMAVPPETNEIPPYTNIRIVKVGKLHDRLWEHLSFPSYVKKKGGVSLNLCNVAPLCSPGIVCIHDAKIKARPQDFSKKFLLWYNFLFMNETKRARKIITVSEFSKKEIMKYYNVSPDRIEVITNAWQHYERIAYDEATLKKYELEKGLYYFSICSLEPNKNFKWIAEVARKIPESVFAIAGSINKTVFAEGLNFNCQKNMRLLGYVSDQEAKTLMRDCKAFLFPTFYEGFGIPPLEAISAGCKNVIVSDTEVMHEVLGPTANYIDPYEAKTPLPLKNQNNNNCLARYSWVKSAEKILSVLRQVK